MTKEYRYKHVINWFTNNMPIVETELNYKDPFQLLIAVILSAQCTDKRVNIVTPSLFKAYPTPLKLSHASQKEVYEYIKSISYPNNKANHLIEMSKKLISDFEGTVPSEIDNLMKLPGVGRKTANVIASIIFNKPVMAVDTHVFRVSNRIGLTTDSKTPLSTEKELEKYIPQDIIPKAHHWLILHGRYVCTARNPKCNNCGISKWCNTNLKS